MCSQNPIFTGCYDWFCPLFSVSACRFFEVPLGSFIVFVFRCGCCPILTDFINLFLNMGYIKVLKVKNYTKKKSSEKYHHPPRSCPLPIPHSPPISPHTLVSSLSFSIFPFRAAAISMFSCFPFFLTPEVTLMLFFCLLISLNVF